jgi:hypothetical protein
MKKATPFTCPGVSAIGLGCIGPQPQLWDPVDTASTSSREQTVDPEVPIEDIAEGRGRLQHWLLADGVVRDLLD